MRKRSGPFMWSGRKHLLWPVPRFLGHLLHVCISTAPWIWVQATTHSIHAQLPKYNHRRVQLPLPGGGSRKHQYHKSNLRHWRCLLPKLWSTVRIHNALHANVGHNADGSATTLTERAAKRCISRYNSEVHVHLWCCCGLIVRFDCVYQHSLLGHHVG